MAHYRATYVDDYWILYPDYIPDGWFCHTVCSGENTQTANALPLRQGLCIQNDILQRALVVAEAETNQTHVGSAMHRGLVLRWCPGGVSVRHDFPSHHAIRPSESNVDHAGKAKQSLVIGSEWLIRWSYSSSLL